MESKIIVQVKKNYRDYKIVEKFVAGIVLTGNEIKSVRNNQVSISESYVSPQYKELYVFNMNISTYKYSYAGDLTNLHSSKNKRKLLLRRKEINKIIRDLKGTGYSLIPLQIFLNDKGWAKLEFALAQRLRKYQIKEKVKEKELKKKFEIDEFW